MLLSFFSSVCPGGNIFISSKILSFEGMYWNVAYSPSKLFLYVKLEYISFKALSSDAKYNPSLIFI